MHYTAPHYYRKFHCVGGSCPDTCCAGWQIQIDPASLKKYRHMPGPIGSRLKNEVDWKRQCFRRYEGRCAFLNEENLCDLYLEAGGREAFCRTCRRYPRHMEEYEGLRELSLSLSCPAAAEIILGCRESVRFLQGCRPARQKPDPDFDFLLFTKLMDARDLMISILQDRSQPIALRLSACLALASDLEQRIDREALFAVDELLGRWSSPHLFDRLQAKLNRLLPPERRRELGEETLKHLFDCLLKLESLRPDWKPFLRRCREKRFKATPGNKHESKKVPFCSEETAGANGQNFSNVFSDVMTEQIMVYFVYTYFCGAVYRGSALGKIKFSLAGTILIRELTRARWLDCLEQELPIEMCGILDKSTGDSEEKVMGDAVEQDNRGGLAQIAARTAWQYAREIEHSDQNKDMLEEMLMADGRFGLVEMLAII